MGYHHIHLPNYRTLVSQYEEMGLTRFVEKYSKGETIIGDSECIKFLEEKQKLCHTTGTDGGRKVDPTNR